MITRPGQTGWQTILADLSLILFMITASALSVAEGPDPRARSQPSPPKPAPPASIAASLQAEPVGLWRDAPGAPPLGQWLADQGRDPRLRLSVVVRYAPAPGAREAALDHAAMLARMAGARAQGARLVIEPGLPAGASVALGYDREQP